MRDAAPMIGTTLPPARRGADVLPRGLRVLILVLGGLAAVYVATLAVGLLREVLHYACSYGTQGEARGAWMCADGIGYLIPGILLLLGSALPLLIGLVVVTADPGGRWSRPVLTVLALCPIVWWAGWLAASTVARADPLPVGESWPGIWTVAVGVPALLAVAGIAVCAVGLSGAVVGHAARWLQFGGLALLLAATIVQPGLGAATSAAAALLAAALPARR